MSTMFAKRSSSLLISLELENLPTKVKTKHPFQTTLHPHRPEAPRYFKSEGKHQRFSFSAVSPAKKMQIKVTECKPKKDAQSNISAPNKQKKRRTRKKRIKQDQPKEREELRGNGARRTISEPGKQKKRKTRKKRVKPDAVKKDGRKGKKRTAERAQKKKDKRGVIPANSKKIASKGQPGMLLSYVIAHTRTSSKKCFLLGEMSSMYLKVPQEAPITRPKLLRLSERPQPQNRREARFFREEKKETFAPKAIIADYRAREDEESWERNAIRIRPITKTEALRLNLKLNEAAELWTGVPHGMQLFML